MRGCALLVQDGCLWRCSCEQHGLQAQQIGTALIVAGLAKRVIACLDVRATDSGDLVVTKGDQYDVRESSGVRAAAMGARGRFSQGAQVAAAARAGQGEVRNLGKPVELARRYFDEGADEISFLNITGFRDFPLGDLPMLEVG